MIMIQTRKGRKMGLLAKLIKKHNEKILIKKGFIYCANCKKIILKTDKFCQYCGKVVKIEDASHYL